MENIIDKLKKIGYYKNDFNKWTLEEKKKLLEIYFIICQKEGQILDLVYDYQGVDSWEDIFRDYDLRYLEEKAEGVKMAINEINNIQNGYENVYDTEDDNTEEDNVETK